ncbi:glycosyl transferase [Edwardsiella piscicida]|nr:glycosyl transferase [Edwardsiella piscicida]ELM3727750.1 glycosyl transferase [Edwardsiella piscicida]ELV7534634.1 glycosyl transferase [Edwardsiella piscicida]
MIAYFMLVHRYPNQFKRLFKSIYHEKNYYVIHVDKRTDNIIFDDICLFLKDYKNASMLERKDTIWGGYSLVDAQLRGIERLVSSKVEWSYFINLSGQDFPLKNQIFIMDYLNKFDGYEFIKIVDQLLVRPETMHRIKDYTQEINGKLVISTTSNRTFLKGVRPYIGNQWMILSKRFCDFITYNPEVKKFKDFYRNTLIADESFFQTILMNTTFKSKIINDDKREIDWVEASDIKLRPRDFLSKDSERLINSDNLFARKFDENVDGDILNILEHELNLSDISTLA